MTALPYICDTATITVLVASHQHRACIVVGYRDQPTPHVHIALRDQGNAVLAEATGGTYSRAWDALADACEPLVTTRVSPATEAA